MSNELKDLGTKTTIGRRAFMGHASALGMATALSGSFLASMARADDAPVKGGVLRAGVQGGDSTDTLDPALAASPVPFLINSTWGDTLVEVNGKNEVSMRLAEEVSSNADASQWMFKIRKGVKFHDGSDMTPDDVVATLKRHTDEKSKSGALGIVKGITDMKVDGDMVTLTLSGPNADLPFLMADYHLVIQPKGGVDNPAAGVGTGAYKIKEFQPGVRCTFERNADYWDAERGHADSVEVLVINDNTARTAALQSGQVHMIDRVDPKIVDLLKNVPGVSIKSTAGRGHYVFIMECNKPPFDNNDLRMALKLAIKRQEMVDKILGGLGSMGNDFPINAAYPLFDDSIPQREYDAAAAAEAYKKSGHDGSDIILQVAPGAFPGAIEAAQLFQQSANAAGIPLKIKREPDDGYWTNVWNVAPFCASYWGGRPVQDQMYSTAYESTADWNDTKFVNKEFDDLLKSARGELDQAKRKEEYSKMANILRDNGGVIVPMFNDWVEAVSDTVGGWNADSNQELMNGKALQKCWLKA
jgi:peptide/nickel transport system substrate-binding protein